LTPDLRVAAEPVPPSAGAAHEGHAGHAGHAAAQPGAPDSPQAHEQPPANVQEGHDVPPQAPPAATPTDTVVVRYFAVSKALVKDDFAAATAALDPLRTAADEVAHAADADVAAAAARVRNAVPTEPASIGDLRTAFKQISESMTALLGKAPATDAVAPVLRRAYCPMADASWLQSETEIENPYMGTRMPHCGKVVEAIETRAAKDGK
jgi:hypothetical protein